MPNVLVTGGAGYIGSHTCKVLAAAGYTPIAYDNLAYGHEWAVKWGPFEYGDICDKDRLNEIFQRYKPHAVFHFAAFTHVGESVQNPGKYFRNNVLGSLTVLEVMRDHHIDKLVFSSTCAIYGTPDTIPIHEKHPQNPINPYGASKLMVERMISDFASAHGIRCISLRYFNAAGADRDGEIGEDHTPETHLIPLVLEAALGLRQHITVFGTDYKTPDGTCIRDYIHVSDLANAHVLSLKALEDGSRSSSYNLGNGTGYSVKQVIDIAQQISGKTIGVQESARRRGDPPRLVAEATNAKRELGWSLEIGELPLIIDTAWQWLLIHRA